MKLFEDLIQGIDVQLKNLRNENHPPESHKEEVRDLRINFFETMLFEIAEAERMGDDNRRLVFKYVTDKINEQERKYVEAIINKDLKSFCEYIRKGGPVDSPKELVKNLEKPTIIQDITAAGEDPNGLNPHDPGAKLDHGKLRAGLVLGDFSNALNEVCKVGTFGANKYSDSGWLQVDDGFNRYKDALYRHLMAYESGEILDKESNIMHLSHLAWNSLALIELIKRNRQEIENSLD